MIFTIQYVTSKPEDGWSGQPNIVINIPRSVSLAAVFDLLSFYFSSLADNSCEIQRLEFVALKFSPDLSAFSQHQVKLRWLKTVFSTFQDVDFDGSL